MIPYKQLSLADFFTDCHNKFDNDKYAFLELLENTINLDEIVPVSFVSHFHAATGRPRKHLLYPMLMALLLQLIFSIPTTSLLIIFLKYSQELRDFCGFDVVPDASKFTRFKQDFLLDLQSMLDHLVDLTEPICQRIDLQKASMMLFDTSGIEAWVTENNPKYANRIIKQLKSHPEIIVEKKSDSPDEDKSLADSKALFPTLKDFFRRHPLINPKTFLGDAAFDSIEIYKYLLRETPFEKAYIPLKNKLKAEGIDYTVNDDGIPCCPHDASLPMKREGSKSHLRCGIPTMKFVCPKMKWERDSITKKTKRVCHCDTPCTASSCGRMIYIYPEQNLRAYPGTIRGTKEWDSTYKIRVNVEKSIHHFKDSFCVGGRKTQNEKTLHADLLLAGITQLITVMVADKLHKHQYIRSLKLLIA